MMKKKGNIIKPLMVFSIGTLASYAVGYGSWVFYSGTTTKEGFKPSNTSEKKVCYIKNDSGTFYFTSLDKALSVAYNNSKANTIYVIPGTNPSINSISSIKSGDSLRLILSDASKDEDTSDVENNGFADNSPETYRKNQVIIKKTLNIESGATLVIAGKTGGSSPQGGTTGDYCELIIGENAKINCNGTINCYGYIKDENETLNNTENDSIIVNKGGKVLEPLAIYDWGSASVASGRMSNAFPFNLYDLPNIRAKMKFSYGANLSCYGHIYGSNKIVGHRHTDNPVEIIGSENDAAFIQLKEGSSASWNFDSKNKNKTDDKSDHASYIDIIGDFNLGHIKVNMYIDFDSEDFYLPVSFMYKLTHKNGTGNIAYRTKFLPGSSLEIASDSIVNVNNSLVFYQSNKAPNGQSMYQYSNSDPSKLLNNGTLNINSAFDGKIDTSLNTGIINVQKGYSIASDSYEADKSSKYGPFSWGGGSLQYVSSVGENPVSVNIVNGLTYHSIGEAWTSDTIDYGVSISPDSATSDAGAASGQYTVTAKIFASDGSKPTAENVNWSISPAIAFDENGIDANGNYYVKFSTPANSSKDNDINYELTLTCSINGEEKTANGTYVAAKASSGGCLLPKSLILMADGTFKEVQFIKPGDIVLSFNHESGQLEPNSIIINEHCNECAKYHFVMKLVFEDGKNIEIAERHGFFDVDENKYVYVTSDNFSSFIGHKFISFENGIRKQKRVNSIQCSVIYTKVFAPVTKRHFNLVSDGMLNVPAAIPGLLNIFEYDSKSLKFNSAKKAEDIKRFGLLSYKDFKNKIARDIYDMIPAQFLSVSIGKGLLTWDEFDRYIKLWAKKLQDNVSKSSTTID